MRSEPPMSLPVARVVLPAASAAPEPPDEPPGVTAKFHGLRVMPHSFDQVMEALENSGVVLRAWTIAPASSSRWTVMEVWSGTKSRSSSEPLLVGLPAM